MSARCSLPSSTSGSLAVGGYRLQLDDGDRRDAYESGFLGFGHAARHRLSALCHHDAWMPPATPSLPVEPFASEVRRRELPAELLDLGYLEGRRIL